tara:strand:+ start:283 stop:1881 length:1599 start_codon:yes stop_codon:yes gene_type:complete
MGNSMASMKESAEELAASCMSPRKEGPNEKLLKAITWNIAAINNNPFEYWITHEDESYNKLMADVQGFIDEPGERDVEVGSVFTEAMWAELKALMEGLGWETAEVEKKWTEDFSKRKIIENFLKDPTLGEKRLASMPDRVTNTINTTDGGKANRPTVISCFGGDMSSMDAWWGEWKKFMFGVKLEVAGKKGGVESKVPAAMLPPLKRAKYPAVTEEEEAISVPLQALCIAIFDAILVHVVSSCSPDGTWLRLKLSMLEALYANKDQRILDIMATTYADADIIFLQEVAGEFINKLRASDLGSRYLVVQPSPASASDQNSLVLLSRRYFNVDAVQDHSAAALKACGEGVPVAAGDLLLIAAVDKQARQYLLASFHGDTNGLATLPVMAAVHGIAEGMSSHRLVFGLDANTYEKEKKGKTQGVQGFAEDFVAKGYTSCWGDAPDPSNHTTFNARTYLQPQLQKAARQDEKKAKGDKNPKDFVLYPKTSFTQDEEAAKDNTGDKKYLENHIFPSLAFPSDHGVVSVTLTHAPVAA